mgnify:CR=1 FL=1
MVLWWQFYTGDLISVQYRNISGFVGDSLTLYPNSPLQQDPNLHESMVYTVYEYICVSIGVIPFFILGRKLWRNSLT